MDRETLSRELETAGVDAGATFEVLDMVNSGKAAPPIGKARGLPGLDHPAVVDFRGAASLAIGAAALRARFEELGLPQALVPARAALSRELLLDDGELRRIGLALYPRTAYGVLNGGSATSYADHTRNRSISPELFSIYEERFEQLAALAVGKPKGLAPAYLNPDGSPGESYIALKLRALAMDALECERAGFGSRPGSSPLPLFQMTSEQTDPPLAAAYDELARSPFLGPLAAESGYPLGKPRTGVQRMIAALTHSSAGSPRQVFAGAAGKPGGILPLPGGHGMNFAVLEGVYRSLLEDGYRWAYLGNVDNLGYTADPRAIAVVALSGARAGFDYSFRTPLDTKGGVLVEGPDGRMTCADLGQAISFDEARELEAGGAHVLFNCATGLFDLEWLVASLAEVRARLPLRLSDQRKDFGAYSQAERNTWEIMGMLDDFRVFAVEKPRRFLSAKMLMETVMMSAPDLAPLEARAAATGDAALGAFADESRALSVGLAALLREEYGLELRGGKYLPAKG